jgi:hypothetical protein
VEILYGPWDTMEAPARRHRHVLRRDWRECPGAGVRYNARIPASRYLLLDCLQFPFARRAIPRTKGVEW